MRIVEIETFGRGGLAHYTHNLASALVERGHEVILVTAEGYELESHGLPPGAHRIIKSIGSRTARWKNDAKGAPSLLRKAEAISDAYAVARLCRGLRPDVVHLHCTNQIAALYVERLRRLEAPLAYTAHVVTPHEPVLFQQALYGRLHRSCDLIVAHSEVDRRRLLEEFGLEPGRVTVIPHGEYGFFGTPDATGERGERQVLRRELGIATETPVALFFGYIREYKGLDVLLEAWPQVLNGCPDARLLIVGDPVQLSAAERHRLERWADRVGAVHRFEYVPFEEVGRYFALADTLVMPYRRISQSGVLFVALSLGLPVVATRVGALPEMLREGEEALLVNPEDPAALSEALTSVLRSGDLRERLARGGRAVAERHGWPAIAERTEAAFGRLVQERRDRS